MVATEGAELAGTPANEVARVFTDLPAELRPPAQATDLPTDRGVGRAALIYHANLSDGFDQETLTFARRDIHLVTVDGRHFRVGRTSADVGPLGLSLSPDGRWLGARRDDRWRIRDLTGTAEYEVEDGYELWHWSTDARSVLLGRPGVGGPAYTAMALPGGDVRALAVRTPGIASAVAFVAGREVVVFDPDPMVGPSAPSARGLHVTLRDVRTDAARTVPVIVPGRTKPGETIGPLVSLWYAGGDPPRIWTAVERPVPLPTRSGRRMSTETFPTALLGVDATSGAATARIEMSVGTDGWEQCRGVVADGVVLQRRTKTTTELIVVDPTRLTRRLVTTLPGSPDLLLSGSRV